MDQQFSAGGDASDCRLCRLCPEYGGLLRCTFYDDRDGIVGHLFNSTHFVPQPQNCDKCTSRGLSALCVFTVHYSDSGLKIKLCEPLAQFIFPIIPMNIDSQSYLDYSQLRSRYNQLKQHYDNVPILSIEVGDTNRQLKMLLDGLEFLERVELDCDVQRHTKLERGLSDLECIGPECSASDGFDSNSTETTCKPEDNPEDNPEDDPEDSPFGFIKIFRRLSKDFGMSEWHALQRPAQPRRPCFTPHKVEPLTPAYDGMNSLRPTNPTSAATSVIRGTVIKKFSEEFHRVVGNPSLSGEITDRFRNIGRAWKCGVDTLRKISNGRFVSDLGRVIAMLCVCSAMARTLDEHYIMSPSCTDGPKYFERFRDDLHRWGLLYKEINPRGRFGYRLDLELLHYKTRREPLEPSWSFQYFSKHEMSHDLQGFVDAVKTIWCVDTSYRIWQDHTTGCYGDKSVHYFGDFFSTLILDFDDMLNGKEASEDEFEETQRPSQAQQTHQPRRSPSYSTSDSYNWPHRLKAEFLSLAVLATSVAFLILFIFLARICATTAGQHTPEVFVPLTQAEPESTTLANGVHYADRVLTTFFERYDQVNYLDVAYPG
ncbi:hypothetical protein F4678DRAFT_455913 [Xylaria arbuscula]|nr:hypothetical protein F4678DRAFT_455913 [Xylaria arbuscula]